MWVPTSSPVWWRSAEVQHSPIVLGGDPRETGVPKEVQCELFT